LELPEVKEDNIGKELVNAINAVYKEVLSNVEGIDNKEIVLLVGNYVNKIMNRHLKLNQKLKKKKKMVLVLKMLIVPGKY